jgi:small ligand-binding sensory domain FIST
MLKPPNETMGASGPEDERPIGEIVGQLIDEGKDFARAELGLAKATAKVKAEGYKLPAILIGAAILVAQAAVVVLAVAVFLALTPLIGTLGAGLLTTFIFGGIAALLVWLAAGKLKQAQ